MNQRILLVDDDPNVLSAFRRQLRKKFDLDFADGGAVAIEKINSEPYAVVVSDMQMPDVDGVQLLRHVKDRSPHTVRIMLTGNSDQQTAIDAVNHGSIFRFINKPCSSDELSSILNAGLEQFRLINAEQELLTETLNGSIDLMADVLSMVNPTAFGRSNRVRDIVRRMCPILELNNCWQLEIAASVSQIGSVTIPGDLLEKSYSGEKLAPADQQVIDEHPQVAVQMVSQIPRLKDVGTIIALATTGESIDQEVDPSVELAAQILKLVLKFDSLAFVSSPTSALAEIRQRPEYSQHQDWIDALSQAVAESFVVNPIKATELAQGMILDEELRTHSGLLLVTKGQQLTDALLARLKNYIERDELKETIAVRAPG